MGHRFSPLAVALVLTAFCPVLAAAQSGVAAGNSAGESAVVMEAAGTGLVLPSPPSGLTATLLGQTQIRLVWSGTLAPNTSYQLFRAKDDQPWTRLVGNNYTSTLFVDTTEPDHVYRYKVAIHAGGQLVDVYSAPSNEVVVGYATAKMVAGSVTSLAISPNPTTGYFQLEKFIPDPPWTIDPPPNPFTLEGPFNKPLVEPNAHVPAEGERYDERDGIVRVGLPLPASVYLDGGEFYPLPFVLLQTEWLSYSPSFPVEIPIMEGAGNFGLFLAKFTGEAELGFDAVSNPKWQMVPQDNARPVQVDIQPEVAPAGYLLGFSNAESQLQLAPQGVSSQDMLGWGGTGDRFFENGDFKARLGIDGRALQVVTVRVIAVKYTYPDRAHPGRIVDDGAPPLPTKAQIEGALNLVFEGPANITFNVTVESQPITFTEAEETDGFHVPPDGFRSDGAINMYSHEADKFAAIAAQPGYRCTIFAFKPRRMKPGSTSFGSLDLASDIPGTFTFVVPAPNGQWYLKTWAHEIGHLLGMNHTFHPVTPYGSAHIPDDADSRLMGYGIGIRLIKPERNLAHKNAIAPTTTVP